MTQLTAQNVADLTRSCLMSEGDDKAQELQIKGVVHTFAFHKERVANAKEQIRELLSQMPETFHKNSGGGHSFLNACMTKDDVQWGEHLHIESLMCLGVAAGFVTYPLPREMWAALPGAMPYFTIDLEADKTQYVCRACGKKTKTPIMIGVNAICPDGFCEATCDPVK